MMIPTGRLNYTTELFVIGGGIAGGESRSYGLHFEPQLFATPKRVNAVFVHLTLAAKPSFMVNVIQALIIYKC